MTPVLTPYDALPADLLAELADAGLDPRAVYDGDRARARRGPAGREDVTSAATDPAPTPPRPGDFAAREAGVVAGLGVAALVFHIVLGDDGRDHRPGRRRQPVDARRRRDAGRRRRPGPAHRGADRAQLRLPPLRRRHRDRGLGRRAGRHPRPGPRHPQDAAGARGRCRSTPCAAAAGSTTGSASSDRAMVKDNHVVAAGGVVPAYRGRAGGVPGPAGRGRGHRPRPAARAARRRAAPRSCSTTWPPRRWPRRCGSPPAAPPSRPPAG